MKESLLAKLKAMAERREPASSGIIELSDPTP
jgi:hypothetical protein